MATTRRKRPEKRKPNVDDQWYEHTSELCARHMARWLKETVNVQRPIVSLSLDEMKCLAANAVGTFLVELSKRRAAGEPIDEKYVPLLLA